MKIGQLAERTGVSTMAIRYYEEIGVLPPAPREPNGYRVYDTAAADRIGFIQDAQSAGMTLLEIQLVLELRDQGESTCGHVVAMLESHMAEIDRQMADLQRTRRRLADIIQRARSLDPANCGDPSRCQTIPKGTA